jgi:putative peptidoglycan lipid II flippase
MSALSRSQIARAALVVVLGFLASGVLGLVRTAAFSISFGASGALDAFYAAQRIPETLFVLVAGGALGSSFIPVFARFIGNDDEEGAWRLASAVMTCVALLASGLALLVALLAPVLVPTVLVPGASPDMAALTVSLTQIMLLTVVIFSISGLLMGILNARQVFTLPALALSMNNIGQIFGALVLARLIPTYGAAYPTLNPEFGDLLASGFSSTADNGVYGLAWGAVLGAALHLAVQLPGLRRVGARLRFLPNPRVPGVRDVLLLMGPRILGLAVVQINFLVNVNFTSGMVDGSRTALVTAWQLMFFALGVIAQGVGTAVFPTLSALASTGDMEGYKDRLAGAMRGVLFLSFPATIGLITLGAPAISLVFEHGAWTAEHTAATSWALAFFALGIAGHALLEVLSRAFYALSDTRTPVMVGVVSMVSNIILSLVFMRFVGDPNSLSRGAFAGLALANSLTTLLEGAALWWLLRRRIGAMHDGRVIGGALRALAASLGMGVIIMGVIAALGEGGAMLTTGFGGLAGALTFFALAVALGVPEARSVPMMVLRRVRR